MPGALMQLVAYGAQDVYLSGNPQMTFFKTVYRRHTNFSMECIKQSFKGTVGAGQRVVATLARNGDLVHDCFLRVPGSAATITAAGQNFGHNMINNIEVEIGGQLIDKHPGHWMEAHAELTEKSSGGVYGDFTITICTAGSNTDSDDRENQALSNFQYASLCGGVETHGLEIDVDFYVPLRFWFCRHVGLALPLIALQYHEVNININFSAALDVAKPELWCNYIYLDTDERRRFAQVSHEYLIEQVQMQLFTGVPGGDTLKLNFNHPVKELVWAAGETGKWGVNNPNAGCFRSLTNGGNDATWQLKLNGHDRFEKQNATYFTRYQPYKYHTGRGIPSKMALDTYDTIGVYSFALKPEEHQPSGTCNFSRIDNSQLIYTKIGTNANDLYVYAVNYNVLRIMSGMGGLAYSN